MKDNNMYKKLPPFKWFVLQNFPFIEEDFDAITNYQLLCKIVEYLNLNIDKTNELGEQVEALTNWFDNLDVQDEIDNKLDVMTEDGTLAEIINEQIFNELNSKIDTLEQDIYDNSIKTPNSQIIDTSIFAQIIPNLDMTGFYFNGFAIGNSQLLVVANDGSTQNNGKIFLYNISSGLVLDYVENAPVGHGNDVTYCDDDGYFYIACGGGSNPLNKIAVYSGENNTLSFIKYIDLTELNSDSPYGIAWNNDDKCFFVLQGTSIIKYDDKFENILDSNSLVTQNVEYVQQSIFYHDGQIGNVINITNPIDLYNNFNKIDIYDSQKLEFISSSKVLLLGEVECADYYNNELYMLLLTQYQGILYKGNFLENHKTYDFINQNLIYNNRFPFTGTNDSYYVDSTYKGFFVDGSSVMPYNNLRVALKNIRNTRNAVSIYLTGDFSDVDITLAGKQFTNQFEIRGTDSSNPTKIGGLNLINLSSLVLANLEITKSPASLSALLSLQNVKYAYVTNIILNGQGTENYGIRNINSMLNLSNVTFNSDFEYYNIYATEGASMYTTGSITINNSNHNQISTENVHLWYRTPVSQYENNATWKTNVIGGGITFNIKDLQLDGDYRVEAGNTCTDAPTGYTDNAFRLNVQNIANSIIYKFIPFHTNKLFIGVLAESQSSITWEEII